MALTEPDLPITGDSSTAFVPTLWANEVLQEWYGEGYGMENDDEYLHIAVLVSTNAQWRRFVQDNQQRGDLHQINRKRVYCTDGICYVGYTFEYFVRNSKGMRFDGYIEYGPLSMEAANHYHKVMDTLDTLIT